MMIMGIINLKKLLRKIVPRKVIFCMKKGLGFLQVLRWEKQGFQITEEISQWQKEACPIPPPHAIKQVIIKEYQKHFRYKNLIETGTYLGDMVDAQKEVFENIISIELGYDLYEKATERFKNKENIRIFNGDSGKLLSSVIKELQHPAILWLDGHYSSGVTARGDKECPVLEELQAIFSSPFNNVILIDDARCFTGKGDYPSMRRIKDFVESQERRYKVEVKYDVIRCIPMTSL